MSIILSPSTVSLGAGETQQFSVSDPSATKSAIKWSIFPAGAGTISAEGLYTAPAALVGPETVTITATSETPSERTGTATVALLEALHPSVTLAAPVIPPYVIGATQRFVATVTNGDGTSLPSGNVTFTVAGANSTSAVVVTNSKGVAIFSYSGSQGGQDVITAVATDGSAEATSNSITANWIAPMQAISTTLVTGRFFASDGKAPFDTSLASVPLFTQVFPTINFNPPSGAIAGNASGTTEYSRPFTDVTADVFGTFTGTISAQGNGFKAGVGPMGSFQAVLTGSFTVKRAGTAILTFYNDDAFILGIGNGATRVSGVSKNIPPTTPFEDLPSIGGEEGASNLSIGSQELVSFPAPGLYPFEIDYTECCSGQLVLTLAQGTTNPTGIPPTVSLAISPTVVNPLPMGQAQTFTVLADDAAGNPVSGAMVTLLVDGADNSQLNAVTDSTGMASIRYQNDQAGTTTVQAKAVIDGLSTYSNVVSIPSSLP